MTSDVESVKHENSDIRNIRNKRIFRLLTCLEKRSLTGLKLLVYYKHS